MSKNSSPQLLLWLIFFLSSISKVQAQITPDHSLGAESSQVTKLNQLNDQIDGGARRGANLFHSFQNFNIDEGRGVYFSNPVGIENILTRVTGNNQSDIFGKLGVLGSANFFLINPHGILFGPNSSLDVQGAFFASTGDAIQLGENGLFSASNPQRSQLLTIQPSALFTNAIRSYQGNINNQGNLNVNPGQSLILSGNTITNSGNITAPGGAVFILGEQINLINQAQINVYSPNGGGTVLIGGSLQGGNNIPTAKNTYIAPGVTIQADALNSGDGGQVIVFADRKTDFYGTISAQGGLNSGNGGLVEVSAKENLIFRGNVNTSAVNGLPGTLLIDPTNIVIANGSGAIDDAQIDDGQIFPGEGSDTFTISEEKLEALSGDTNVILQATNDIIVQNLNDNFLNFSAGNGKIEFTADSDNNGIGDFTMQDPQDTIRTNGRDIYISGANLHLGSISTALLETTTTIAVNVDAGGDIADATGTLENPILHPTEFTFTVSNLENIDDLDLIFSATHTFVSDLSVQLTSPQGTTVNLFASVGNDGVNFQDTRLNDQAARSITEGIAPFVGEFRPGRERSLAQFNGENPNGRWTLTVTDNFPDFIGTLFKHGDPNIPWTNPIGTQLIFTSGSAGGDSGSIQLNATNGNINAVDLDTSNTLGKTGNILLNATGGISILDQINTFHTNGDGGTVRLQANGNINLNNLLNTSGGIVNGSLANGGSVLIESENGNLHLNGIDSRGTSVGGNVTLLANEQIWLQDSIFSNGDNTIAGDINITTNGDIILNPGIEILASSNRGLGGNINLTSQGNITMIDGAISTDSGELTSTEKSGSIKITANTFSATNTAQISTFSVGSANAGDIKITAEEILIDNSFISAQVVDATGNGGDIDLIAKSVSVSNNARIFSASESLGNAGNITINTTALNLTNNAQVSAFSQSTFSGNISIENLETLQIDNSQIIASTANGNAGSLSVNRGQSPATTVQLNQGIITVRATGTGSAGNLALNTNNLILDNNSVISAANVDGTAGSINITSNTLSATNGGQILTTTSGLAKAGNITLNVLENLTLDGDHSGIFANTTSNSSGDGGSINIDPQTFIITNGAGIGVNSQGSGRGGDILLQAGTLSLDNQGFVSAETASNQGGNININIQDLLLLRNNSRITATAGTNSAGGDGGNININAPFIIAFPSENSDITANAFTGDGGQINITTNAIFGLRNQPELTDRSDITASSQFGLAGDVQINTPDVDPTSGLIELPGSLVDAASLVTKDICSAEQRAKRSSFTIIGKGGLAAESDELISNSPGIVEWVTRSGKQETTPVVMKKRAVNQEEANIKTPVIQEAQGWIITADGRVILTANAPKVTPQSSGLTHPGCH
ncbi:MAG: hypothetical protein RLZZ507_3620 [Cyanobacteriota bacterium]|jgi:filamentous hemagglutinin family protein